MKRTLSILLAMLMLLGLCACGGSSEQAAGSTTEAASTATESTAAATEAAPAETTEPAAEAAPAEEATGGTLILGTSADYAPFEFMYPDESGNMVFGGIDVSAAQYIADKMGMTLQVENMAFDYLLVALQKGDFDIVMAAIEDTEERRNAADFSDPYYTDIPAMILVRAEDADAYQTLNDFDGKVVSAQTATTKLDIVNNDMPGAIAQPLQLVTDMVNELVNGKVDALVLDGAVAMQYAETNEDLVVAAASDELGAAAPYCVAVAKGDPKGLLPGINEAIAAMTAENATEQFVADAEALSDVAQEVSADAPTE